MVDRSSQDRSTEYKYKSSDLGSGILGGSWDLVRCRVPLKGAIGFYNRKGLGVLGST